MTPSLRSLGLGLIALVAGCEGITPPETLPPPIDAQLRDSLQRWRVVPIGPLPAQDPKLVDLGQALMFDPILSGNRDVACATCHHPSTALADGLPLAVGTGGTGLGPSRTLGAGRQFVPRSAPSLLNVGLGLQWIFWDGRISSFQPGFAAGPPGVKVPSGLPNIVAVQAMFPVLNRTEMRGQPGDRDVLGNPNELAQFADSEFVQTWQALMRRLLAIPEYVTQFNAAFPGTPTGQLAFQDAATAIAAFELQAFTKPRSAFDRYLDRDDGALTIQEKRGALLFFGKARCSTCHNGPLLGANQFASTGVPQIGPGVGAAAPLDVGRGALPNQDFYRFAFRVTPLRNVELTAPYMHDGAFPTLEAVVRHYNDVPGALRAYDPGQLSPAVRALYHGDGATINAVLERLDFRLAPLDLTEPEQKDLVTFLKALTDPAARDLSSLVPARVPSDLPVPR